MPPKIILQNQFCYVKNQSRYIKAIKLVWIMWFHLCLNILYIFREKGWNNIHQNIDKSNFLVVKIQYSDFYFIFLISLNYVTIILYSSCWGGSIFCCFLKVGDKASAPRKMGSWLALAAPGPDLWSQVGLSGGACLVETLASVACSHPHHFISKGVWLQQTEDRAAWVRECC